jgi:hypothetical protein
LHVSRGLWLDEDGRWKELSSWRTQNTRCCGNGPHSTGRQLGAVKDRMGRGADRNLFTLWIHSLHAAFSLMVQAF